MIPTDLRDALHAISPAYEPSAVQVRDYSRSDEPRAVLRALHGGMTHLRRLIVKELAAYGADLEDVTPDMVLRTMQFQTPAANNTYDQPGRIEFADKLAFEDLAAVFTSIERRRNFLKPLYQRVLGRMPDTPGLMFWGNVIGTEPGWTAARIEQQMIEDRDIRGQS